MSRKRKEVVNPTILQPLSKQKTEEIESKYKNATNHFIDYLNYRNETEGTQLIYDKLKSAQINENLIDCFSDYLFKCALSKAGPTKGKPISLKTATQYLSCMKEVLFN